MSSKKRKVRKHSYILAVFLLGLFVFSLSSWHKNNAVADEYWQKIEAVRIEGRAIQDSIDADRKLIINNGSDESGELADEDNLFNSEREAFLERLAREEGYVFPEDHIYFYSNLDS